MVAELDLFAAAFSDDPYPIYHSLREQSPVQTIGDSSTWMLTGFDAVYSALRDHQTFSSATLGGYEREHRADQAERDAGLGFVLINDDPPRHTRFRGLVNRAFTPRRIDDLEPWIETIVDELLNAIDEQPVDIVGSFTIPFPVTVISTLLGIPPEERERFKRWSNALVGGAGGFSGDREAELRDMRGFLSDAVVAKRAAPAEDLITALGAAAVDGERLQDWEVLGFCMLLLVAGNETTTNLIGNMLHVLADRPELWAQLREDRSLVDPMIEETLRYDGPVHMQFRITTRDAELAGVTIPARSPVVVGFAAANRDPAEFPQPDEFRIDRGLTRHLAFGIGIHYCLGSPLARVEARIALNALLDRYGTLEHAGTGTRTASPILRGFERLPLRFGG